MTTPTWADPAKPLAKRVELAMLDWDMTAATEAHRDELLADAAAADRLARAYVQWSDSRIASPPYIRSAFEAAQDAAREERDHALAAYRARKGVTRGE